MFEFDALEDMDPAEERLEGEPSTPRPGTRAFDFDVLDELEGEEREPSGEEEGAPVEVPAGRTAQSMQLRGLLQRAWPKWSNKDVESAQARLQQVGVESVTLLTRMLAEEEAAPNNLLCSAGLRPLRPEAVAALRSRLTLAAPSPGRSAHREQSLQDGERKLMEDRRLAMEGPSRKAAMAMAEAGVPACQGKSHVHGEERGGRVADREHEQVQRKIAAEAEREQEAKRKAEEVAREEEARRREEEARRREEVACEEEARTAEEAARKEQEMRRAEEAGEEARRRAEEAAREAECRRRAEEATREAEARMRGEEATREEEARRAAEAAREAEARMLEEAARELDRRWAEEAQREEVERRKMLEAERELAKAEADANCTEQHEPRDVHREAGEEATVQPQSLDKTQAFLEEVVLASVPMHDQIIESFVGFDSLWKGVQAGEARKYTVVNAAVYKETKSGPSPSHFQIRLPVGADVATLRSVLSPAVADWVKIYGEVKGGGMVPLWESEIVPSDTVFSDFPGRPNKFYARFSVWECLEAHRMVKDFLACPENQQKVEEIELEAGGDETRHQMLLVSFLTREIYPELLRRFGLPEDVQPFQTLVNCFVSSFMDLEVCRAWFESELLMRNRRKCTQAYAYLAFHHARAGLGLPCGKRSPPSEAHVDAALRAAVAAAEASLPAGGAPLGDGYDHLRLLPLSAARRMVSVELPWAWRLAKRLPVVVGVVTGVYSESEADALKELVESRGHWKYANGKGRTGLISELHLHGLARDLWSRMKGVAKLDHGDKRAAGLSEHLRFLKYGPGNFFAPHEDSSQNCVNEEGIWTRSVYSALLYLSDPEEGDVPGAGGTRFVAPDCPACAASGRCEDACDLCVDAPVRKGDVLLFAQSLLHAGTMPRKLEKFVMRTDIMFAA